MDKIIVDGLGSGAALCSMASFTPQVLKIWQAKDAESISLRMYALSVLGFSLWTAYGVLIGRWPLVACNAVCLGMCVAILVLKWRYRGAGRKSRAPTTS